MTYPRRAAWLILATTGCSEPRCPPQEPRPAAAAAAPSGFRAVVRHKNYLLELGHHALEVDPADGGRVVAFSLDGRNVLQSRAESPEAYGSSFWTSPQSDWSWPPPFALDRAPWSVRLDGRRLELTSGKVEQLGLSAQQVFEPGADGRSVVMDFKLHNHGPVPRAVAPWQNTRVRPGGLTFFPSESPSLPYSSRTLVPEAGVVWFRHDPATMRESGKMFADGVEGWLAHLDGELLLVKVFPDIPPVSQAPREAEIEIYVHDSGRFVEVEQQGAYSEIEPGGSSSWRVHWLLERVPPELAREPERPALLELVRRLVSKLPPSAR